MNLYLIWIPGDADWDTYSDAVVCAKTADDARTIHPSGEPWEKGHGWTSDPKEVKVKLLGTAARGVKRGVVCASFHAG
jgi:hypothetical protein